MLTSLVILSITTLSRPEIFNKYPSYHMAEYHFVLSYEPPVDEGGKEIWKGETEEEASKKLEKRFPDMKVLLTWNAGYYATVENRAPVDFVMIDGVVVRPRGEGLDRTIIAFRNDEVAIFERTEPDLYDRFGLSAYDNYLRSNESRKFLHAFAGDLMPTKPDKNAARRIIGLRGTEVVFISLWSADWDMCKKEIAEQQLDSWIYLDGGSSVLSTAETPVHISVLKAKSPARDYPLVGIFYILD